VVDDGDNDVSAYSINATTGALTPVAGSPFATGDNPTRIAVDPTGKFVYVTNSIRRQCVRLHHRRDQRRPDGGGRVALCDGPLTSVRGGRSFGQVRLCRQPKPDGVRLYRQRDQRRLTPVAGSPFPAGPGPDAVAIDSAGKFAYAINDLDKTVSAYTINAINGALRPLPGSPWPLRAGDLLDILRIALDPTGKFVYVNTGVSSKVFAYTIDATSGALTRVPGSPFATGDLPVDVTVTRPH